MKSSIDVQLLEELSSLEYYIVKTPINSKDFWKEWQEKFSRVYMAKVAAKKLLKSKKMSYDEISKYKSILAVYEEILYYLEVLKALALQVRGFYSAGQDIELDDEDIDIDF
ncbi:hypothetical protein [Thermocrinis sp.]|uniref:hypothetical protein n=1 Tax=Thermocrinis sp. TaxID=2024383 RepID=UPI002FDD5044